ncbi:MAG: hypothetical protein ACM359_07285 [Bacillota bacterium]
MSQHDAVRDYCQSRGYSKNVVRGGIPYLMSGWKKTVERLEAGRRQLIWDYLNDLGARHILAEVLPLATEEERGSVEAQLADLDARFRNITVPSEKCVWREENASRYGWVAEREWWYFRQPPKSVEA